MSRNIPRRKRTYAIRKYSSRHFGAGLRSARTGTYCRTWSRQCARDNEVRDTHCAENGERLSRSRLDAFIRQSLPILLIVVAVRFGVSATFCAKTTSARYCDVSVLRVSLGLSVLMHFAPKPGVAHMRYPPIPNGTFLRRFRLFCSLTRFARFLTLFTTGEGQCVFVVAIKFAR